MIKPNALRAAITAMLPDLGRDPDKLAMFTDKGRVVSTVGTNRAFQYLYTLQIVIEEWQGHPSVLFLCILDWLRVNQPDLLTIGGAGGVEFEADILGTGAYDIMVSMQLTEAVVLRPRVGGGFDLEHLAEPDPMLDDDVPLADPVSLLRQIWHDGELIVPLAPTP